MASTYCQDGSCESIHEKNTNTQISNTVIIGGFVLYAIALAALVWYGASVGIYPDLTV